MRQTKIRLFNSVLLIIIVPMLLYGLSIWKSSDSIFTKQLLMSGVVVVSLMAFSMAFWVYGGIIRPLEKLQEAMNEIKEGNLDNALDAEDVDSEIRRLMEDFEEMRIRLKENQEEKLQYDRDSKELISNITHDLKTPITSIKGYVEGIMDGVARSPEQLDRYIRTIYSKANDMDHLINELTFYTKIDANHIPYHFEKVYVAEFFRDCADDVGTEMEAAGFRFSFSGNVPEDVIIIADAEQMKRVINNVVSNSVKYNDKEEGEISITLRDDGDFVEICVEDNGAGISREDLPNIFNRFYRADSARGTRKGGSGIGLSIVKKIIEDHGGRVWARSQPGKGTAILFSLRKHVEGDSL